MLSEEKDLKTEEVKLKNGIAVLGDALEFEVNEPVDMILTDPPYNISQENNFKTMNRSGIDFGEWDKDFDLFSWLKIAHKVLKKGGSLIIFNSWKNIGEIAKAAKSVGFDIKDLIRWEKTNPMPRNRDRRYITDFELAVWLVKKGGKWTFNRQSDTYDRPKFEFPTPSGKQRFHPTQKNVDLLTELIKRHTNVGETVLDLFAGSGSTGIACIKTNRKFILNEKDKEYFKKSIKWLKTEEG